MMAATQAVLDLCLLCLLTVTTSSVPEPSVEKKLVKSLLDHYEAIGGSLSRPVADHTETLNVEFGTALIRIDSYEKTSEGYELTMLMWDRYTWKDAYLQWDPAEHGGIEALRIPPERIWRPDIIMYNAGPGDRYIDEHGALAVVTNDGTVLWVPRVRTKVLCRVENETWLDPGEIVCLFKFGSWTYDGFNLDLDFYISDEQIDLTDFTQSAAFEVTKSEGIKNVKYYACCVEPYVDLSFRLHLKLLT